MRELTPMTGKEIKQAMDISRAMTMEAVRARKKWPLFASAHEGWGVLREEYKELEAEIMKKSPDRSTMAKEAMQVGAMAIRIIQDCCEGKV